MVENVAKLTVVAFGAFTVGAEADDGTKLELDLISVPGGPTEFYNN